MKRKSPKPTAAAELRRRAEERLRAKPPAAASPLAVAAARRQLHELQVHQIELEMQNAELVQSRAGQETSAAEYADLYDFAPVGYFTLERSGLITRTNLAGARLLGFERGRRARRRFGSFVVPAQLPTFDAFLQEVFAAKHQQTCEVVLSGKGKTPLTVLLEATLSVDGRECRVVAVDITARQHAEEQLKASFKEFGDLKAALDQHAIVAVTDPKGKITYVNDKFCAISKYSRAELLGQDHRLINSGFHPKEFIRELWATISRGQVWRGEMKNRAKDGSFYWVDTTIVPFLNEAGQPHHHIAIRADITERKRAEQTLAASREQLRALLARLQRAQEEERTRVAREIHDELGQLLTGLKMDVRWLERKLSAPGLPPVIHPLLDRSVAASELADTAIATVQKIAAELRPGALDHLGLAAALSQKARRFEERSGIHCTMAVAEAGGPLPPQVATELFYICQEALTNVTRHARAKNVEIHLRTNDQTILLEVRDDGVGLAKTSVTALHSLGLLGMKERVMHCHGTIDFQNGKTGGAQITVRIPRAHAPPQQGASA